MGPAGEVEWDTRETGNTLTSAPVSTKKRRPLEWSVTKNRRLGCRLEVLTPGLGISRPVARRNTSWHGLRTSDDTSRGWTCHWWSWMSGTQHVSWSVNGTSGVGWRAAAKRPGPPSGGKSLHEAVPPQIPVVRCELPRL